MSIRDVAFMVAEAMDFKGEIKVPRLRKMVASSPGSTSLKF